MVEICILKQAKNITYLALKSVWISRDAFEKRTNQKTFNLLCVEQQQHSGTGTKGSSKNDGCLNIKSPVQVFFSFFFLVLNSPNPNYTFEVPYVFPLPPFYFFFFFFPSRQSKTITTPKIQCSSQVF